MSEKETIVNTKSGKLEGGCQDGLFIFKGIPYAEPPVGKLRWMPPEPVKPWEGVRPAKEYGAIAPQNPMPITAPGVPGFEEQPHDEDCLFLNVWTPGLDDARRPVMVWIHGGAFIIGCGSEPILEGGKLPKRGDIVLVSMNYRMGAFGFMNLNEVTNGKIPATGNEGLLDQVAALEWVRDNIAAFGGDPDNVTVSGFSAGGMSIGVLLSMPLARGKFHKAMNRSGATNVIGPLEAAVNATESFLKILDLKGEDVESLRSLKTQQLLGAQEELGMKLREAEYKVTPFQPVMDGRVVPEWPIDAVAKGFAKNVALMAGNTLDEMKAMTAMDPATRDMDEKQLFKRLNDLLPPDKVPGLVEIYREALKKRGTAVTPSNIMGTINVDLMFRMPTLQLVESQRDNGAPAYNYLFTYQSPAFGGALGAMHGSDSGFLFDNLDPVLSGSGPEVEDLAVKMQDSAIAFIRTGDPSCESLGKWPPYGKDRMTMILDKNPHVEAAPYEEERRAWDAFDIKATRPM